MPDSAPPLLATKMHLPSPRPQWIPRPRLLERLAWQPDTALVLVAAPAGFGKTTLLASWCHRLLQPGPGEPAPAVAWVSLDEGDNDPVRFFGYVVAALGQALGPAVDLGPAAEGLPLLAGSGWEGHLAFLINALDRGGRPCLLVLDDFHHIHAPAVHAAVAFLLERLPAHICLAIGSRATPPLPLSRLRARGQLVELLTADLRFSPAEVDAYLERAGGLPLSPAQAAQLGEHCEGWAAGLQLSTLALRTRLAQAGPPGLAGFLAALGDRSRTIVDYLLDEVFAQQPPAIQDFLLKTALLDRLNAALCAALLPDLTPAECQATLENLEQNNLFTLPLDDAGEWFRYHRLFAGALRTRLERAGPGWAEGLHRRASAWFASQGLLPEAISHALQAPDPERAAGLIEQAAGALLAKGEIAGLLAWLAALPAGVLDGRPGLRLAWAWSLVFSGQPEPLEDHLQAVEQRLADPAPLPGREALQGRAVTVRAFLSLNARNPRETIRLAEEALARLPAADQFWRGIATRSLGEAYLWAGNLAAAGDKIRQASEIALEVGDLALGLSALNQLAGLEASQGRLQEAERVYRQAFRRVQARGWQEHPYTGVLHAGFGSLLLEWNQLAEAAAHILAADRLARLSGDPVILLNTSPVLARLRLAQGDLPGGLALVADLGQGVPLPPGVTAESLFGSLQARFYLSVGQLEPVVAWAQAAGLLAPGLAAAGAPAPGLPPDDSQIAARPIEYLTLARLLLAQGQVEPARPLVERLVQLTELMGAQGVVGYQSLAIEALAAQALVQAGSGEQQAAYRSLAQALALGEPAGYIRLFLDLGAPFLALLNEFNRWLAAQGEEDLARLRPYLARLLAAAGPVPEAPPTRKEVGPETLSAREVEVLELVAQGCSNQAIAGRLVVSLATVKSHVNHIMRKLDAVNRTEAVARGRELGLIS